MSDPVLDLIQKHNLSFTISGRDYVTRCLNPEHNDNNPSFRIDKVTGICHCFSCGYKTNIFKHYGVISNFASIKIAKLKEKLNELARSFEGVPKPDDATPFTRNYRGISPTTFKHFDAYYTFEKPEWEDRVWFPILDQAGRAVAHIGRHLMSHGNPRYMITPRHTKLNLYPQIINPKSSTLILVEGIFDMLNMWDKGCRNVACTFGTSTLLNDTASKLLVYKAQGITHIYLMYDGDKAGQEAMEELKPLIEEAGFVTEIIKLEEGMDPGDFSQEYVDSIKEYTKREESMYN